MKTTKKNTPKKGEVFRLNTSSDELVNMSVAG